MSRNSNGSSPTLDMLFADAAQGSAQRFIPGVSVVKAGAKLATRPQRVARRASGYGAELVKIAAGRSEVAPSKGDRRFKDDAWQSNPLFRVLAQSYLATSATVDGLVDDADLEWADERRLRFATDNVVEALAPSNNPLLNPTVLKAIIDTGGANLLAGARAFASDMARPPRVPTMVDQDAFAVGEDLALSPGEVVLRTDVLELIQFQPTTGKVRKRPLLVVPPMINKYYITDLAPGRSMIEYAVGNGQQVFAISWRNPGEECAEWDLDTYAQGVIDALDAVEAITTGDATHLLALCAGGIVAAGVVAHLTAQGQGDRIAGLTLGVSVLDNRETGTTGAFADRRLAAAAVAASGRQGYLDGRALAGVFAWLRPTDLVWNYWINNYLLGRKPPAFDILYWNADSTNLPAGLHRDFMAMSLENSIARPGKLELLGTPIDLSTIECDSYVVAGIADHISPWESCYRTTHLLGSDPRFVLSTSGHIAAMVNPPGNDKASYRVNGGNPGSSDDWLRGADECRGSWWEDWDAWLAERSGPQKNSPRSLGKGDYAPLEPAPGRYVHERV